MSGSTGFARQEHIVVDPCEIASQVNLYFISSYIQNGAHAGQADMGPRLRRTIY
jgi:hypothetical protein